MAENSHSNKVIMIAFFANLGIAIAKAIGSVITGSAALLAEAVHSAADCTNQVFLLIGSKSATRAPSDSHPLGYGREMFFWSFLVAILLFSMGGLYAVIEGAKKLSHPTPIEQPWVILVILGFGILLEGYSFHAALKEVRRVNPYGSLWKWFRRTTRADLLVILTEDFGALAGLIIAAVCVSLAWATGDPSWDAIGSILVGSLLLVLSLLIAVEVRSLIIGEAPEKDLRPLLDRLVPEVIPGAKVLRMLALQTGGEEILLSYKVSVGRIERANDLVAKMNELEKRVKAEEPRIRWQFIEPDTKA